MNIIGDLESANKYYIKHDDGSIEWTSNLSLAKSYVQDMTVPTWFGQTLYCTNEDVDVKEVKKDIQNFIDSLELNVSEELNMGKPEMMIRKHNIIIKDC